MTTSDLDEFDLDRFITAQDDQAIYARAAAELRRGRKTSHWMWFIFPQIVGLGHSPTARHFAISSLREAQAYLDDPVLGPRLEQVCNILLTLNGFSAQQIFGSTDTQKLRSSMTLFDHAQASARSRPVFHLVLEKYFAGIPDQATVTRL